MLRELFENNGMLAELQVCEVMDIPNINEGYGVYYALLDGSENGKKVYCTANNLDVAKESLCLEYAKETDIPLEWIKNELANTGYKYTMIHSSSYKDEYYLYNYADEKVATLWINDTIFDFTFESNFFDRKLITLLYTYEIKITK